MIIGKDPLPNRNPFGGNSNNTQYNSNNISKDNKYRMEQQKRLNITDQNEITNKSFDILQEKLSNGHITLEQYEAIASRINKNQKK